MTYTPRRDHLANLEILKTFTHIASINWVVDLVRTGEPD
jgi:hypothetical protein